MKGEKAARLLKHAMVKCNRSAQVIEPIQGT
jgi:hypothetical protein